MTALHTLGTVVRQPPRADAGAVAALAQYGVATIHEAMGRTGLARPGLRSAWAGARLCGTAVTVLAQPGDNWMLHVAAEQLRPGDVVVVACTAESTDGMFGELLATSFRSRGAVGLVTEAGIRDVRELAEMGFPAFARAFSARGTVKATLGSVNVPVVCAGALVHPGDVVAADDDGMVVVPRALAAEVAAACAARERKEATNRARFLQGELGLDVYGMRDTLAKAGLRYVDPD
ncbi:4-carboxy-4-hydroxy-2-oxoadipate aldolase/oxaloacetate decarboxylase [Xylophilus sp. Leaf220]|uniref:4-carboxy-4-hydroxy-2-oxoadipate aldolase/oxaloacetate decarboxylase n=1 Tax=Xylophilus sp. Leaf220 TaxID=1735686 RepID=UPI0006F34517|nr:4-carboxy-4-hydroxy-2-oxoadipate aldolase/oxaloacetate decarboxylase [Xylophilus sp. Leaf220]KQM68476.1 4-carboxy-4-hydroxy-2-oxoadipate aldolase/oxaloacetate decarboxylase [Xylophilus sp. Leaf220]